jgi:ankyrin repeat protein
MHPDWERAAKLGDVVALGHLHDLGAEIDAKDSHGQTALMLAARGGYRDAVEWLTTRGAALDHTAKYRLSALMLAVVNGHAGVVRVLVAAGANRDLRGTGAPGFHEKTALDLARERGDEEMMADLVGLRPVAPPGDS